jgi:carbamate kinase
MAAGSAKDGWRRVVPSPRPHAIEHSAEIIQLISSGTIVVACGGGGVPVVERESSLVGVEAVVDKDLASCVLAQAVGADAVLILTDVDAVYAGYGTPRQERLTEISATRARELLIDRDFGVVP